MFPVHTSTEITAVVGARSNGDRFEGVVNLPQGTRPDRQQVVWPALRDTERQALADARRAARKLVSMWRKQASLLRSSNGP